MERQRWATFDCYGTLIDWNGGIARELERVFGASAAPELLARYHEVEPEVQREQPTATYRDVLGEVMRRLGAPAGDEGGLAESLPGWEPFPEVRAALEEARARGWTLAILSNTDRDFIDASMARIGVPFELAIVASEIGSYKPAVGHWRAFADARGRLPDVHVGASLYHDIATAGTLGLPSVWVNRLGERTDLATREIPDLATLPAVLDELVPRMIPAGFEARPCTPADAAEAAEVINAAEAAHCETVTDHMSEQEMVEWLGHYDLAADTRVVRRSTGELCAIGMLELRDRTLGLDCYVDPGWTGRGIGSSVVAWAEDEARRRGLQAVRVGYLAADTAAERLLAARGYGYVRSFFRMIADLEAPPEPVTWPDGCALSTLDPGGEADFHTVIQEAFADHWGSVARPLDEWTARHHRDSPDPALWFLVRADGEPAAAALCSQSFGMGWIGMLGVRPAFRRRGLGRLLLLHGFRELYARGERRMGLGVDATNETGATRLYESAGMRVAWQSDVSELRLP